MNILKIDIGVMAKPGHRKIGKTARENFATRLIFAREQAGYETQIDFAEAIGVESATYSRWERAETEPDIAAIGRIVKTLNVSADYLLVGKLPPLEIAASSKTT